MIPSEVLSAVKRIEIKTGKIINSIMGGEYKAVFKGNGMEFADVRKYFEGDDVRMIDWNVTARTGEPFIKRNIEERELTVILMVDMSASSDFGTKKQFKSQMIAELTALLAFSAIKNNDRVGLLLFSDKIEKFIPPKKGKKAILALIRELLYYKSTSKKTDIAQALAHINQIQKKKAVIFCVSDFICEQNFEKLLSTTAKRHDFIAVSIDDPRENELVNVGLLELYDAETGDRMLVDTGSKRFREQYKSQRQKRKDDLAATFLAKKIDQISLSTETGYIEPLIKFFHGREKRR
ncbi:MAG: DUF58 domain-containing protein [Chitinivibrionia bacterium]|nr:DUF58 domain-containing protein [Chitinivibrionia bacterium]